MLNRNTQYYEWLLPYLEGGLDEARRAQLEARLAADPALAAEAKRLARTLGGLRGAASRSLRPENASVPADLWPHLRARLVLDPVPRPRPRAWWLAGVGAPAAAALIVAAIWLPGWHPLVRPELASKTTARPTVAPAPPRTVRRAVAVRRAAASRGGSADLGGEAPGIRAERHAPHTGCASRRPLRPVTAAPK